MAYTREKACNTLGVPIDADMATVKSAYRQLAKLCHPDSGEVRDGRDYLRLTEAYEFLVNSDNVNASTGHRLIGKTEKPRINRESYASYKERLERHEAEKREAFQKRVEACNAEEERKEKLYNDAMEAIRAVIAAEAIKQMIHEQNKAYTDED